jgi:hypothetical protein
MKAILPLIKSTLRGGLKVACGIVVASVMIGGGVWGYSLYEERQEEKLAQARHWEAKEVPALRATMRLKTKYEGSYAHYILTIETAGELDALYLTLDLVDAGGFKLCSEEIEVASLVGDGAGKEFSAEGLMDTYMRPKDYKRAVGWNVGWKVAR